MPDEQRTRPILQVAALAMAAIATLSMDRAMTEPGESGVLSAILTLATIVGAVLLNLRLQRSTLRDLLRDRRIFLALVAWMTLPLASETMRRTMYQSGMPFELLLLASQGNLCLALAALSAHPRCLGLSQTVSLFVLLCSMCVSEHWLSMPLFGAFTTVGTVALLLTYWNKHHCRFDSKGQSVPVAAASFAFVAAPIAFSLGVVVPKTDSATILAEWFPSSGGTSWRDPFARGGVGDGDDLASGKENPQTFGFTDSDVYLESDDITLYDVFNEQYGEPYKPRNQQRAVSISSKNVFSETRTAEHLKASREFSVVRLTPRRSEKIRDVAASAIVYVHGPVPVHLRLAVYEEFDGERWKEVVDGDRAVHWQVERGWICRSLGVDPRLGGEATHKLKNGGLHAAMLPLPATWGRFKLGAVDRADFFRCPAADLVCFDSGHWPKATVVDVVSHVVRWNESSARLCVHSQPEDSPDSPIELLAAEWTQGRTTDADRVAVIIRRLRSEYVVDANFVLPQEPNNPVDRFLLESRRGPDYLFASAATLLLRAIGCRARLVSGLYADAQDFDAETQHTLVRKESVHFWTELYVPGVGWTVIEPTPGYEAPTPIRTWRERIADLAARTCQLAVDHSAFLIIGMIAAGAVIRWRREWTDAIDRWSTRRYRGRAMEFYVIKLTQFLERRAGRARLARRPSETLTRWLARITRDQWRKDHALQQLIATTDWSIHSVNRAFPRLAAPIEADRDMLELAVDNWPLSRFRAFTDEARSPHKAGKTQ